MSPEEIKRMYAERQAEAAAFDDRVREMISGGIGDLSRKFNGMPYTIGTRSAVTNALRNVIYGAVHLGADRALLELDFSLAFDLNTYGLTIKPYTKDDAALKEWERLFPKGSLWISY